MSEDAPTVESEGKPGQISVRKLRLKMPSEAPTSSTIRFPSPSFSPEWQEVEDDPWADEACPFLSPTDPQIGNDPKDNSTLPEPSRLEDSDSSSSVAEISQIPVNLKRTRQRKCTDSKAPTI